MEDLSFILNGMAHGTVAQKLQACGMSANALRPWIGDDNRSYINVNGAATPVMNAATLRKDEWKHYDTAVIQAAQERLVGIADLESRGLVYNIGNGLGKTVLEYEDLSDFTAAELSMDGVTRSKGDRPVYGIKYLPLPIISKDFTINARVLAASRTTGDPLDVTSAQLAARVVAEKAESLLFTGASSYAFGGGTLYGLTDFPQRNTGSLSVHWDHSAATGATVVADVLAMKQALIADGFYGPYMLYVPTGYDTLLDEDYTTGYPKTIRARIKEIDGIQDVKVADKLTADNVILVQMTSDVIRVVNGMPVQTVEWNSEGGMVHHFKVMTIKVPQIRADQNNKCGVAHWS